MEEKLQKIFDHYEGKDAELIPILQEVQHEFGYLPEPEMSKVAKFVGLPKARIYGVATFFEQFKFTPQGKKLVTVCRGTACHVRGAPRLLDSVQDLIGIRPGETDLDMKFSLDTVSCVGCCALGPVMVVDDDYHGKMAPAKSEEVLKNYE